jgi:hypothetical protein
MSLEGYGGPVSIAVDTSVLGCVGVVGGLRGCMVRERGISRYTYTKEVISMDVSTDDVHDSEVLPSLLKDLNHY